MQVSGEGFDYFWDGYLINQDLDKISIWQEFIRQIVIPDSIKQSDLLKVYVYNPSKELIYIDDFRIEISK